FAKSLGRVSTKDVCIERGWIGISAQRQPTEPVGSGRPSPLGLFHLLGNVFEWCLPRSPREAASGESGNGPFLALGGGWASDRAWLEKHLAKRVSLKLPANWRMKDGGFRVCLASR
ncbi:MAG TPA: SUMF1/EgtB/PvdO family nonheme iron enzyme, partial [Planctomycetaceae bacterium]|nr:SUMF1/EgtB/PvdO family nonheme iron enzyme [Planctomycetaceae bacterium]